MMMRRSVVVGAAMRRSTSMLMRNARPLSAASQPHFPLWLDGAPAEAIDGATLPVEDPSTGELFATTALGSEADVAAAVASAKACHEKGEWRRMGARGRGRILRSAADKLRAKLPSLVELETRSTGRARREYEAQLGRVPEWLEYHASLAESMEGSVPPFSDATDHLAIVRRRPLGVCGLITPWNHPLLIATKKVAVALATGNTIVVKPPELAPASVVELARCLTEAGAPPGAINVCTGLGPVAGRALVEHPDVAKIDFTGGTEAGRTIGALAGAQVKHYCAELGGNAPVLVFEDADVDEAVNGVAFAAFVASGQTCVSAKRILVQESIFEEFKAKLVAKADGLRLGAPLDAATQIGPLASGPALAKVEAQLAAGYAEGAVALAGGRRPGPERCPLQAGHFLEPTVLGHVTPSMSCVQEEIFGPVVSLQSFADEAGALALANDNEYALGAGVWTANLKRAHRVMEGLHAGVIWANTHHRNSPDAPWGGFGASGIGRENGLDAHREYTASATMIVRTNDAKEDWFAPSAAGARYG